MSIENAPAEAGLPVAPDRLHRITIDQYHHLIATGFFGPSDRLVLLDGLLVNKMPKGPRHSTACGAGFTIITAALPADWSVRKEEPLALAGGPAGYGSVPEPDLAVVAGRDGCYLKHHPGPVDIALVVEFADSHLPEERRALARYAWAGIPVAWIVNLANDTVEVYTDPWRPAPAPRYRERAMRRPGDSLTFTLPGRDEGDPAVPVGPSPVDEMLPVEEMEP